MIQPVPSSPMPATVSPALPGEAAVPASGDIAETLDFSALLALESDAGEPLDQAPAAIVAMSLPRHALAGAAAETGKILPSALPEETAGEPQPEAASPAPVPEPQATAASLVTAIAPALPTNPQDTAGDPPAEPAPAPRQLPAVAAQAAVAALLRRPGPAQPALEKQDHPQQIGPVVAETLTAALPAAALPSPRKTGLSPAPAETVQIDLARLAPAIPRGELRLPVESTLVAGSSIEAVSAAAQPSAGSAGPQGALPGAVPAQPVTRPHDFSALIDRLTAAREALAPQSVAITVAHQDFGPVRLRFRSEDSGLSVAISSADPAFARAAATAPLPVLPAGASDQAALSQQRGDSAQTQTGSSNGSGGFAQQRGGSPERRDDDTRLRDQPHRPAAPARHDGRRDIFA